MKKILAAVLIALAGSVGASTVHGTEREGGFAERNEVAAVMQQQDYDIRYTVRFDTAAHYLNVRMEYTPTAAADVAELVLNMPMWTPGYYEMLNFPKHLCDFAAMDTDGKPLAWRKEGMNRWRISLPASGKVCATWRIYANRRDVASSRVEGGIAFVAPAGVFMHVDGQTMHPVTVRFDMPSD